VIIYKIKCQETKQGWDVIQTELSQKFGGGEQLDIDAIIYLIGIQELGKGVQNFKKDDKINIMHIAICTLLEPFGYYEFDYYDKEGWPHFKIMDELPNLKSGEQTVLIKEAIVMYFDNKGKVG
jgi:hypothetical protein